jgi:hypothetical protein
MRVRTGHEPKKPNPKSKIASQPISKFVVNNQQEIENEGQRTK